MGHRDGDRWVNADGKVRKHIRPPIRWVTSENRTSGPIRQPVWKYYNLIGSGGLIIWTQTHMLQRRGMCAVIADSLIGTSIRFESPTYFKPTHATLLHFYVLEFGCGLIWLQCFRGMTSILWCNPVSGVTVQSSSALEEIAKDCFCQCVWRFTKHRTKHVL